MMLVFDICWFSDLMCLKKGNVPWESDFFLSNLVEEKGKVEGKFDFFEWIIKFESYFIGFEISFQFRGSSLTKPVLEY